MLNLRGIRESGSIFAVPTYLFLVGILIMLAIGMVQAAQQGFVPRPPVASAEELSGATQSVTILLILTAFSRGCAALTGVEAISDGVPAFQPPEWKNARTTLTWMIGILAVTFAGITFLAHQFGIVPREQDYAGGYETVVSQIARTIFGGATIRLLLHPVRHHGHPDPGRQHGLLRLPATRVLPGPRQVPPAAIHLPRRPPRLLARHHHAWGVGCGLMVVSFNGETTR